MGNNGEEKHTVRCRIKYPDARNLHKKPQKLSGLTRALFALSGIYVIVTDTAEISHRYVALILKYCKSNKRADTLTKTLPPQVRLAFYCCG